MHGRADLHYIVRILSHKISISDGIRSIPIGNRLIAVLAQNNLGPYQTYLTQLCRIIDVFLADSMCFISSMFRFRPCERLYQVILFAEENEGNRL